MNDIKYCEDCKHCVLGLNGLQNARCSAVREDKNYDRFVARKFDVEPDMKYCAVARVLSCGPDAKLFEPKTVEAVA